MPRAIPEWIGKTCDTPVPPRVKLRVYDREKGLCHRCGRPVDPNKPWTCEHLVALINGGENRESNLGCTCDFCLPLKNADDVAQKATTYRKRTKYLGITRRKALIPGSRGTKWKMTFGRGAVLREQET